MASPSQPEDMSSHSMPAESGPKLEGEALVNALRQQLEFYFSRQNLASDSFLLSQMNAQKYVPIEVIANFRKVKSLTEDKELLLQVMRQCKNLATDESGSMVRPNLKMERNTLILRDIPSTTPPEEVRQIFENENCAKLVSLRPEIGDTWFATFENEEACTTTAMYLAGQTFQGKQIHCRVKSENLLRGFFYPMGGPPAGDQAAGQPQGGRWRGPMPNNGAYGGYNGAPMGGYGSYSNYMPAGNAGYQQQPYQQERRQNRRSPAPGAAAGGSAEKGPRKGGDRGAGANAAGARGGRKKGGNATGPYAKKGQAGAPGSGKGSENNKPNAHSGVAGEEPELGPEHFPALPNTKKDIPVGYTRPFLQYSREVLASIVTKMNAEHKNQRPESIPVPSANCVVVRNNCITHCQLLEPFPVMYPASPSPLQMAANNARPVPFLDLNLSAPIVSHPIPDYPVLDQSQVLAEYQAQENSARSAPKSEQSQAQPDRSVFAGQSAGAAKVPKYSQKPKNTQAAAAAAAASSSASATSTPAGATASPAPAGKQQPAAKKPAAKHPKYAQKVKTAPAAAAAPNAASAAASSSAAATSTSSASTASSAAPASTAVPAKPTTPPAPVKTAAAIVAATANKPLVKATPSPAATDAKSKPAEAGKGKGKAGAKPAAQPKAAAAAPAPAAATAAAPAASKPATSPTATAAATSPTAATGAATSPTAASGPATVSYAEMLRRSQQAAASYAANNPAPPQQRPADVAK